TTPTLEVDRTPARPAASNLPAPTRERPSLTPPAKPATGTLVLDLPEDASAAWQGTLNGEPQKATFTAPRALGFVVPAGVGELRVRHRSRDFSRLVLIRAGAQTAVTVMFPRRRLLLEFTEDVPEGLEVWVGGSRSLPTRRGRRFWE